MVKQPILAELENFINGVANFYTLPPNALVKLSQCSLHLLENLPASRDAVFEYFALIFDTSVSNYVQSLEKDPNGPITDDESLIDIQDALEKLVFDGKHAWSPYISDWSLRILGVLSTKYNRHGNKDIGTTCNFWLGCSGMRCLLGLTASCFEKLTSRETEECITTMLNTYVMNSPHFDWVVARLGGSFPFKVISKILHCGLKEFAGNNRSGVDSEVGILAYLSFAQEVHLQTALKDLLVVAIQPSSISSQPQLSTIPYFLSLCDKSTQLLQPIVSVFLELYDDSVISILCQQSQFWPSNFNVNVIVPALSSLALQIQQNSTKIILLIARIAETYAWCQDLLEHTLQDLDNLLYEGRICPLEEDIIKDSSQKMLINSCLNGKLREQQTAVRLMLLFARQSPLIFHTSITELLLNNYENGNTNGLGALIRLISGPTGYSEFIPISTGIEMALESVLIQGSKSEPENAEKNYNILKNLLTLLKLEQRNASPHLKQKPISSTIPESIPIIMQILSRYMDIVISDVAFSTLYMPTDPNARVDAPDNKKLKCAPTEINKNELEYIILYKRHIHVVFELLDIIGVGQIDDQICMIDMIKLSQLTTKYFFWSMIEEDSKKRLIYIKRSLALLARLCATRKYTRIAALRELLEGALYMYGNLFGAQNDIVTPADIKISRSSEVSLMKMNQTQNALSSVRGTLHSGTIGSGLKIPAKESQNPLPEARDMLLKAITACCKSDDNQKTIDGFCSVSLLLVEMVSSDVMYNGLPWPDEEFSKVTMERDLQIQRTIKNAPILWSILALTATYRPSLCFASVLLRGICASLLHQWRAKSVIQYPTSDKNKGLYVDTKKLVEIMSMGQILPEPFNYLHMVIDHFQPAEIALVMKECIWNYMKENVPSPVIYSVDSTGLHWRDSFIARPHPQFIDPLRQIMLRKLPNLGAFYHQMFIVPEGNQPRSPQEPPPPSMNIPIRFFEEPMPGPSRLFYS